MIDNTYVRTMARYGTWQNESLAHAASEIDETALLLDRGGFFGSIFGTLNHLLWGDRTWMNRFAETPQPRMSSIPESVNEAENWEVYLEARSEMNQKITDWAALVDNTWLAGNMSWFSGAAQKDVTKPTSVLVMHFFNHATHHRGQAHAMLTSAGAKLDDTDLFLMPEA